MKISVCMATYNGEQFLKEQLDSILHQLSRDDEVIISDDGSTDQTLDIIQSYTDDRVKLYHSIHKNLIYNFENALKHASGDIIFLSDQDDIWFDDKVVKLKKYLTNYLLVFSNALVFNSRDGIKKSFHLYNEETEQINGLLKNIYKNNYIGATMAFRAELLEKALPFPKKIPMHDMWLGLLANTYGRTYYLKEPLIFYRRHGKNASLTGVKSTFSIKQKIIFRHNILIALIKRIFKLYFE